MIRLEGVSKVYKAQQGEVRALDNVSFAIGQGEFVAVRGPSGCGKSTLLALVGGLALPTRGRITVAGQEISSLSAGQRAEFRAKQIGFVFQLFHLLPYLTVTDNVLLAADNQRHEENRSKTAALLEKFGLSARQQHLPPELSAGERQRVAMARALLNEPKILLADEPTGNLDPTNAAVVLDLVADYHRCGATILLATHDQEAAQRAQRFLSLDAGRLIGEVGEP